MLWSVFISTTIHSTTTTMLGIFNKKGKTLAIQEMTKLNWKTITDHKYNLMQAFDSAGNLDFLISRLMPQNCSKWDYELSIVVDISNDYSIVRRYFTELSDAFNAANDYYSFVLIGKQIGKSDANSVLNN